MQVILGGAYNGKRQYVHEQLANVANEHLHIFEGEIPEQLFTTEDYVVIGGFEKIVEPLLHKEELQVAAELYTKLRKLSDTTNLICICTDMSRGIVPLDKKERQLRDTCGRLYQQFCANSETVVRIWYGIPQQLKGEL